MRSAKLLQLDQGLQDFSNNRQRLLGVINASQRNTLAMQMVASLRRLDYTRLIKSRDISADRADPDSNLFEPERAAALLARNGRFPLFALLRRSGARFGSSGVRREADVRRTCSDLPRLTQIGC